jgi:hypothetical protein
MTRPPAAYLVLMPDGRRMDTTPLHSGDDIPAVNASTQGVHLPMAQAAGHAHGQG